MNKNIGIAILSIAIIILLVGSYFEVTQKEYEVKFVGIDSPYTIKVDENSYIKKVNDPIKEGYEFIGWYNNNIEFDFNKRINHDIILEARWISK